MRTFSLLLAICALAVTRFLLGLSIRLLETQVDRPFDSRVSRVLDALQKAQDAL